MEIFIVSFVVILLSCGALAIGQLFGRKPINGSCRPNSAGHCAHTENCSLRCIKRRPHLRTGA
jgi:hypothetical protein